MRGKKGALLGPASAAASFGWRNGCASPGEGVDSCRQRSQIGNPGLDGIFSFSILPLRMASFAGLGALSRVLLLASTAIRSIRA